MGRVLLLLVGGAAIAYGIATATSGDARIRQGQHATTTFEESMARQAARSGFAIAERAALESFGTEFAESDVALDDGQLGSYDAEVTASGGGVVVEVTGRYGSATHRFVAAYDEGFDIPAALIAHAQNVDTEGDPAFGIDGAVHKPPSAPSTWDGSDFSPIGGIATSTSALGTAMRDDLGGRASRITGSPAWKVTETPSWIQDVVDEAPTYPGAIIKATGRYNVIERSVGRPDAPAVVVAREGALLGDGARGYGVLIVTGNFRMIDDARWEGLVIVLDTPGVETTVHIEDDAKIYGVLALHGVDEGAGPAPYGDFLLRMLDTANLNWSADPLIALEGTLPAFSSMRGTRRTMLGSAP